MIDQVKNNLVDLISYRPFCFMGILLGLKDLAFGIGFVTQVPELTRSMLYLNYDALVPGMAGMVMGFVFIPLSIMLVIAALINNKKWVRIFLTVQATVWLFNAIMYALNGTFFLAIIFFLAMSAIPGYMSQWMGFWEGLDRPG